MTFIHRPFLKGWVTLQIEERSSRNHLLKAIIAPNRECGVLTARMKVG